MPSPEAIPADFEGVMWGIVKIFQEYPFLIIMLTVWFVIEAVGVVIEHVRWVAETNALSDQMQEDLWARKKGWRNMKEFTEKGELFWNWD